MIKKYPNGSKVKKIKTEDFNEPITVGFEIMEIFDTGNLRSAQNSIRRMEKELIRINRRKDRLEKDINHILTSTSWKVTEFIRNRKRE